MATTLLKAETAQLVAPVREEPAPSRVEMGGTAANYSRHRQLLEYLNDLVATQCPSYLRNDLDDIVQTVLLRLSCKLSEIERRLAISRKHLLDSSDERGVWVASLLGKCLEDIDMACDRRRSRRVKSELKRCIAWIAPGTRRRRPGSALKAVRKCLAWFEAADGREVFAKSYIWKGVQWAILDARKKFIRKAEVSPQDRGDDFLDQAMPRSESCHRSLEIRQEISDCLGRLDEDKRFATFLALLGYRCSEIAEILDLSIPQTESRIRRGKARLRECLNLKGVTP